MNGTYQIIHGDCFEGLRKMRPKSVHCCVSSPPYLGLRDYGIPPRQWADGSLCVFGLEPSIELYVAHTVELFDGLRYVLRDDGVIWWNVGDSYSSETKFGGSTSGKHVRQLHGADAIPSRQNRNTERPQGSKLFIPHRVAIGLQDAGWIVRQDNVWAKKSPMPESISGFRWQRCRVKVGESARALAGSFHAELTSGSPHGARDGKAFDSTAKWSPCPGCDKCESNGGYVLRRGSWRHTNSHEYIFQIVKSAEYFCDGEAASEVAVGDGDRKHRTAAGLCDMVASETRNPRSTWHLSSESYKGAHFATFPSELVRRCLIASCSKGGCCPACGNQYAPIVEKERIATRNGEASKVNRASAYESSPYNGQGGSIVGNRDPQRHIQRTKILGYRATCSCNAGEPVPPTVLDTFSGSGTTLQVATHMGFNAIGFERNESYIALAHERIATVPRCLLPRKVTKKRRKKVAEQGELFS